MEFLGVCGGGLSRERLMSANCIEICTMNKDLQERKEKKQSKNKRNHPSSGFSQALSKNITLYREDRICNWSCQSDSFHDFLL